ncbi:MAG TPA: hypothetical protein P5572_12895 [Phycisphaerae bacterium]|nr:hypothetical protein [Phycisphaerales bacterium]HRX85908.1 hypothetical protein [Phycisphaerae bacterium]
MWSDEYDPEDDGVTETVPCPACGQEVYEDADQCPACGEWIIPMSSRSGRSRRWVAVVLVVAALMLGVWTGLIRWFR